MWKNSDEFLLLSVWMLYVISEFIPELARKNIREKKQTNSYGMAQAEKIKSEMKTEMRMVGFLLFYDKCTWLLIKT